MTISLEINHLSTESNYINLSYRLIRDDVFTVSNSNCTVNVQDFINWYNTRSHAGLGGLTAKLILENHQADLKDYLHHVLNTKYIRMYWEQSLFLEELKNDIRKIMVEDTLTEVLPDKKPMKKATGRKAVGGNDSKQAV